MSAITTPEQPTAPTTSASSGFGHTRRLLIAYYAIAIASGVRDIHFWEPSNLDLLLPIASAVVLGWWAVVDARRRRHPIPTLAQPWFILGAGVLVPGYVVWSRRWRGVGWIALHVVLWLALATTIMQVGGYLVYGDEWLRALGLLPRA